MNKTIIAVIGGGNMGTSLVRGLVASGYVAADIWVTDPDPTHLNPLAHQLNVMTTTDNHAAIAVADVVIFAVKPQDLEALCKDLARLMEQRQPLVISVAAGISTTLLDDWLQSNSAIVRCMPNTAALIGCSASALFANAKVSAQQRRMAEALLRAVGLVVWLDNEAHMDIVTALSGSGPAYFFLVMEAMAAAAEKLGLPEDIAKILTLQTGFGATRMALESPDSVSVLRQRVTSKGGTTECALAVLEQAGLHSIFFNTLQAAALRSAELAHTAATKRS